MGIKIVRITYFYIVFFRVSLAHACFVSGYTLGIPLGIAQHPPCSVRSMCMRVESDYDVGRSVMMMSRKEMKCLASLSSLVNRSDRLMLPAICLIEMVLFWTDSRMAFSRIWTCRSPLVVMFDDHRTQALLSL